MNPDKIVVRSSGVYWRLCPEPQKETPLRNNSNQIRIALATTPQSFAVTDQGVRNETIRKIAIIAHVDHGKTTRVDAMLRRRPQFFFLRPFRAVLYC